MPNSQNLVSDCLGHTDPFRKCCRARYRFRRGTRRKRQRCWTDFSNIQRFPYLSYRICCTRILVETWPPTTTLLVLFYQVQNLIGTYSLLSRTSVWEENYFYIVLLQEEFCSSVSQFDTQKVLIFRWKVFCAASF